MSFEEILEKKGKTVILRKITNTTADEFYQTQTQTFQDIEIKAIITGVVEGKELLVQGYEVDGKLTAWVSTQVDVSNGDLIIYGNKTFKIEKLTKTDAYIKLEAIPWK